MNREILFRGQTRRRGEKVRMDGSPVDGNWVYGGIFPGIGDFSIIYSSHPVEKHVVYTDTVGQYTGLTDKNGKRIFKGDVVKTSKYGKDDGRGHNFSGPDTFRVDYEDGGYCLRNRWRRFNLRPDVDVEVIGNVHDNPELIGGEDDA